MVKAINPRASAVILSFNFKSILCLPNSEMKNGMFANQARKAPIFPNNIVSPPNINEKKPGVPLNDSVNNETRNNPIIEVLKIIYFLFFKFRVISYNFLRRH